jgi:hypothetical protein
MQTTIRTNEREVRRRRETAKEKKKTLSICISFEVEERDGTGCACLPAVTCVQYCKSGIRIFAASPLFANPREKHDVRWIASTKV